MQTWVLGLAAWGPEDGHPGDKESHPPSSHPCLRLTQELESLCLVLSQGGQEVPGGQGGLES